MIRINRTGNTSLFTLQLKQHSWSVPTEWIGIAFLSIIYLVGIVGILWHVSDQFILLTPVNLLVSLTIVLLFHPEWQRATAIILFVSYLVGFGAEWFGVQTGLLFGEYRYGPVLGPQWQGTPFMIGINWMLLVYCSGITVNHLIPYRSWWTRGILAALLMVGLDLLIEPVAMELDFWQWAGGLIPLQNYVGWFIVALPLTLTFARWHRGVHNKVAVALFLWQFLFFLILFLC